MKHHSLRIRMTLVLVFTVTAAIFISWVINSTFLGKYYQYSKLQTLDAAYNKIYTIVTQAGEILEGSEEQANDTPYDIYPGYDFPLPAESQIAIDKTADEHSFKLIVFDIAKYSFIQPELIYSTMSYNEGSSIYYEVFKYYVLDYRQLGEVERLKTTDSYDVYKIYDEEKEAYYIDLIGMVNDTCYTILRTNFENMQESSKIANQFFSYVGIAMIGVSAVIMYYISKRFTMPLRLMSGIAKEMTSLNFEAYYPVKSKDEIGELGYSLNLLSSQLKATITELKNANNVLQKDIEKRTELDEMRKDFLSNVTHELKTPIALIQGYAEGLKENLHEDAESREFYCEVIVDESEKMNNMVKKLLSLSHIESGSSFEMERFDISSLIRSIAASYEILLKQNGITLHIEEYEPIYVWADEYLIEEAITNYVSNAVNHAAGAKIIEIKLIKNQNVVRAAVYNTGEQIPEEDLDKIWIKFYKIDKARTREYGGSGIGLSIVKAIMDSHNKPYGVQNHHAGVEFWLELDAHV